MKINLTKFLNSISYALDSVEQELIGVMPLHARRVAILSAYMADSLDMGADCRYSLIHAALLHDCALKEYLSDEYLDGQTVMENADMSAHCIVGESIAEKIPYYELVKGAVLYHHEKADGTGTFGKKAAEIPAAARMIHIADEVDMRFDLSEIDEEKFEKLKTFLDKSKGTYFSEECVDAFLKSVDYDLLMSITGDKCITVLEEMEEERMVEVSTDTLRPLASVFADITDYKSHFTWNHSMGIAEKAEIMGRFYGYPKEECDSLFIAGALHDVGKLFIDNGILEKPGKLTDSEYKEIQNHAMGTHKLLDGIEGMELIASWAGNHHEKLDGSGYPFRKTADQLEHNDRLMACLDIYQALVEERPYKKGLFHEEAMAILNKMGSAGQLDDSIIQDIDKCFAGIGAANASADHAEEEQRTYSGETWRCPVCGYIHEGHLPDDFICPQCEQPGSIFERADAAEN